ncbi:hypothetical protein SK128_016664 [Halocaridina rubra]|uniref:Uncharacterized protein n=1 Tax=Halocaridina rubra TaxID=373956 RepID=A0AAN8X7T3_HALRR
MTKCLTQGDKKGQTTSGKNKFDMEDVIHLQPKTPPSSITEAYQLASETHASSQDRRNDTATMSDLDKIIEQESAPPQIMRLELNRHENFLSMPIIKISEIMDNFFSIIALPFSVLVLIVHHLIRLVLRVIIRPLFLDSLILVVEYIWRPIFNTFLRSCFTSLHLFSIALSDWLIILLKPIYLLCKSIRCVEINYSKEKGMMEV